MKINNLSFVLCGFSGCVTGLLKIGTKNLYVFDENGDTKMIPAMCVLDFYIHESRQRAGLGKEMFEVMLERENVHPIKLAIDRPSDKFLAFLRKHYGNNTPYTSLPFHRLFHPNVYDNNNNNLSFRNIAYYYQAYNGQFRK